MCLYTNRREPYIAKRDIYVVKVLVQLLGGPISTPVYLTDVSLNSLLEAYPKVDKPENICERVPYNPNNGIYCINAGAIHSYKSPSLDRLKSFYPNDRYLFKIAYIPKGEGYWISETLSDYEEPQIASPSLFITDIDYKNPKQLKWLNFKSYIKSLFSWMKLNQE
jgi:hypothetical protein